MGGENIEKLKLFLEKGHLANNNDREILQKINPKQIVDNSNISISVFEVKYSYTTVRGNKKERVKIFIKDGLNPERDMMTDFNFYINNFNKNNPYRKLSNVKFLDSKCLGYMSL